MSVADLLEDNLPLVERVIATVCRRAGLRDADAEDFGSTAKLALIENDYAILRSYEGRAPLGAFLTVVIQRLLSREWIRVRGRWRPSAEAERLGPAAVLFEKLTLRDGRAAEEAAGIVCSLHPELDRAQVRELGARLPQRPPRPRLVPIDDDDGQFVAATSADARAHEADAQRVSARAARVVRETLAALPQQDRMLLRFHFGAQMSIADAARILGVPQRPLYRRVEALLLDLRKRLEREGIDGRTVADLISAGASQSFDFGLRDGKTDSGRHTPVSKELT